MPLHLVLVVGTPADARQRLLASLAGASGVWTMREPLLERAFTPDEAEAERPALEARLGDQLRDREGRAATGDSDSIALATADGSHPFLAAAFPGARFVSVGGDVADLPADRLRAVNSAGLIHDPRTTLRELCAWIGIEYDMALLGPFEAAARSVAGPGATPFASSSTDTFPKALAALGGSLLISTYQSGKLVAARVGRDGSLNTHFRDHDKPMGMALGPGGRLALGTRTEIWDYRDVPELGAKLPDTPDACFVPRNRHTTGDIAVHEMGFVDDRLWIVNTAFSCLATLNADHSFVPRWRPPFISGLGPGDRCHLNGMAIIGDRVRYVTALGTTDTPGGWRADKATGGVLIDVLSNEIVARGLSMPHSPRWHDNQLWVLQSGKGELSRVDVGTGRAETVVELPGFTRGLAIAGRTAFVGLSQIRESSTFGDLPITQRLKERVSGVWMVDLDNEAVTGFLRFEDLVQEIFDVLWLPARFPEIVEPGSPAAAMTYALP